MATFKEKFNKKHNQPLDTSNSLTKIARLSGISKSILQEVYNRGIGAHKTQPSSVRNVRGVKGGAGKKMSKEQWAIARVYGFVGKNPKQVGKSAPDRDLYEKTLKKK